MDVTAFFVASAVALVAWGLVSAWIGARRGDDAFEWWLLGTALGPLSLPALLHAHPRTGTEPRDEAQPDVPELVPAGEGLDRR